MSTTSYNRLGDSDETWTCPQCHTHNSSSKIYSVPIEVDTSTTTASDSDPNLTHSLHDSSIPTDTEIGMTSSPKHKHNTSPKTGRGKNLRILNINSPGLSSTSDSDPNLTHSLHDSSIPTDTEIGMTSSPKHKHNTSPKTGRGNYLRILNINFQSARKKGKHLEALIDSTDPDIIIGTETWLDDEVSSAEVIPNHLGYDVHRRDRPKVPNQKPSKPRKNDRRRRRRRRCGAYGGVFIAAKKELQLCEIEISKNIELISGALRLQNEKKATVAAFYRPPSHTDEAYTTATRLELQQLRRKIKQGILIIGGDFNTPDIDWNTLSIAGNQYPMHVNQTLLDFVADSNMEQQVDFPTRQKKTLDLILTTHPSLKTRCKALPSVGNSDHDVVLYDTSLRPFRPKPPKHKILLWKKANVHAIRKDMEEYAQTFDIDTSKPDALETAWRGFSERVQKTINKNVPSKTTQGRYSYPWIDTSLRRAIRRKQRAHTKARKTGKKRDQDRYKRLQQEVKDNIKKASHHYLDTVVTDDFKTNSKKLWAYFERPPSDFAKELSASLNYRQKKRLKQGAVPTIVDTSCVDKKTGFAIRPSQPREVNVVEMPAKPGEIRSTRNDGFLK
ncbi:hypothetical protein ACOMHN_039558 [Nucella lapillus]